MAHKSSPAHELARYLRERLRRLEICAEDYETRLSDDRIDLCRKVDEGVCDRDDPDLRSAMFHLEYELGNTFRQAMLVALCSYLEEALKAIGSCLVVDYTAKLKKQKGSWLERHISVLCARAGVDRTVVAAEIAKFGDMIVLRNCVTHSGGNVRTDRDSDAIRGAVDRIDGAAISEDDFLLFNHLIVPEAIVAAEGIADHILGSTLGVSIV